METGQTPRSQDLAALERQLETLSRDLAQTRADVARLRAVGTYARVLTASLAVTVVGLVGGSMRAQTTSQKVVAPFEVVDNQGKTVMRVSSETNGPVLNVGQVFLGRGASGNGYLMIRRTDDTDAIALGVRDGAPGVYVLDSSGNKSIAVLGQAKVSGGVAYVADSSGIIRMLMSGQGELHAADGTGRTRATLTQDGAFTVRNAAGITVARLGENNGVGQLQIANSVGNAIVEAGQLVTGAGIVRAYPIGTPGMGVLGMPGTFIVGFLGGKK